MIIRYDYKSGLLWSDIEMVLWKRKTFNTRDLFEHLQEITEQLYFEQEVNQDE